MIKLKDYINKQNLRKKIDDLILETQKKNKLPDKEVRELLLELSNLY